MQISASVQVAFTHGVASSTSIRTFGVQKEGTCEISKSKGSRGSTSDDGQVLLSVPSTDDADGVVDNSENAVDPLFKKKKREYKEPWVINLVHFFLLLFQMDRSTCCCCPQIGCFQTQI